MLLHYVNFIADVDMYVNDTSVNEIESVTELVLEVFMGMDEDTIPEDDRPESSQKVVKSFDNCCPSFLPCNLSGFALMNEDEFTSFDFNFYSSPFADEFTHPPSLV